MYTFGAGELLPRSCDFIGDYGTPPHGRNISSRVKGPGSLGRTPRSIKCRVAHAGRLPAKISFLFAMNERSILGLKWQYSPVELPGWYFIYLSGNYCAHCNHCGPISDQNGVGGYIRSGRMSIHLKWL